MQITLDVSPDTEIILRALGKLHGYETASSTLEYLAMLAVDGVSRSGSWERAWLHQAFPLEGTEAVRAWAEAREEMAKLHQGLSS